ncbi:MAG: phenylacetate--CoA ligase family protein [Deltaproteobacteria bacterium]|nr:phenylacetate--CoA ligase family protein [Deltaproteobacteria bacterium]
MRRVALPSPVNVPASALLGVRWPAVPAAAGATALAIQFQLQQYQWWSADALRAHQLTQLAELLRHARATAPFWAKRLEDRDFDLRAPLTWDRFERLPLLTRRDLQDHEGDLRCRRVPDGHGPVFSTSTSGSTGQPVTVHKTEVANVFWRAITLREHLWHQRDLGAKLAMIRYVRDANAARPPRGARQDGWGPSTDWAYRTGPASLLAIRSDVKAQAKWLQRENPTYLLSYPSNLLLLARHFQRGDKPVPPSLRQIRTMSETLTPDTRRFCEEVFGVPIVDIYSTQEVGYVALQCPDHLGYHVQSETVIVEVLDDDGRPCRPGTVGRVVVTPLHNYAMPLIRYQVGDFAEVGEPCPCGRGLPVLKRILGRVRNMLTFPDGRRNWPVFADDQFVTIAPIRQYQFVQKTRERIEVRFVADRVVTPEEEDRFRALINGRLGYDFDLVFTYHPSIPRDVSGKFEDFKSEVEPLS